MSHMQLTSPPQLRICVYCNAHYGGQLVEVSRFAYGRQAQLFNYVYTIFLALLRCLALVLSIVLTAVKRRA